MDEVGWGGRYLRGRRHLACGGVDADGRAHAAERARAAGRRRGAREVAAAAAAAGGAGGEQRAADLVDVQAPALGRDGPCVVAEGHVVCAVVAHVAVDGMVLAAVVVDRPGAGFDLLGLETLPE